MGWVTPEPRKAQVNMSAILLVDDEDAFRERMSRAFQKRGYSVYDAPSYDDAMEIIRSHEIDMGIFDLRMEGKNGLMLVRDSLKIQPALRIVVLTGYGAISTATEAIKLGAISYLAKPADIDEILLAFDKESRTDSNLETHKIRPPSLARVEWEHIQRVLSDCNGNISAAAKKLNIHRRTLQRKLFKYAPK